MEYLFINSIMKNQSLSDGPGYRTVLFLQGCNIRCKGCHNTITWDINSGIKLPIKNIANELRKKSFNKKITISGGEPLMQKDGLTKLLNELNGYDICLYTSYDIHQIPKDILNKLTYIKTGRFVNELKNNKIPYFGSENQKLYKVKDGTYEEIQW